MTLNALTKSSPSYVPVAELFCARTGRREVPGSVLGRACRSSRSEFSVVFFEIRVNVG